MAPTLKRPMYGPNHPDGPTKGRDVKDFVKRTLYRLHGQTGIGENFFPKPPGGFDDVYNQKTQDAVEVFQKWVSITPASGYFGQATLNKMWDYADAYSRWVYRIYRPPKPPPPVPDLGPIYNGGQSVLDHDLTHNTAGIPGYPAFDDGWVAGLRVVAPEAMTVTAQSSSQGGDAFYATGESKLKYWFGHLAGIPYTGRRFQKGETMAIIASMSTPHVHCGIDAVPLIGHELLHHTDYSHGAPTVGEQLRAALE